MADVRQFILEQRIFRTRAGGRLVPLPLIARLDFDSLVGRNRFPGYKMIPPSHVFRRAFILTLLGKFRRSHARDPVFDQGVAPAAGLNAIAKLTFMWHHSLRLGCNAIARVLGSWV